MKNLGVFQGTIEMLAQTWLQNQPDLLVNEISLLLPPVAFNSQIA